MQLTVSLNILGYFHCKDNQFQSCFQKQLWENICIIVHPLSQHNALLLCTSTIKLPCISILLLQCELIIEMSCQTIDMRCHSLSDPIKRTGWNALQFFTLTGKNLHFIPSPSILRFPHSFPRSVAKPKINYAGRYGHPLAVLLMACETHWHSVASSPSSDRPI